MMKCPYCGDVLHKIEIKEENKQRIYWECFICGYCSMALANIVSGGNEEYGGSIGRVPRMPDASET